MAPAATSPEPGTAHQRFTGRAHSTASPRGRHPQGAMAPAASTLTALNTPALARLCPAPCRGWHEPRSTVLRGVVPSHMVPSGTQAHVPDGTQAHGTLWHPGSRYLVVPRVTYLVVPSGVITRWHLRRPDTQGHNSQGGVTSGGTPGGAIPRQNAQGGVIPRLERHKDAQKAAQHPSASYPEV